VYLRLVAQRLLGVRATERTRYVNTLSGPHPGDSFAPRHDNTTGIAAGRIRQVGLSGVCTAANVTVHRIHARSVNLYHNLPWPRLQIGHILQFHHLRTAELVYTNGFHSFLLCAVELAINPHKRMFASNCSTSIFLSAVNGSSGSRGGPP